MSLRLLSAVTAPTLCVVLGLGAACVSPAADTHAPDVATPRAYPTGSSPCDVLPKASPRGPRLLVIVAHPDDEIAFAGTLYKTSTFLDGMCDVTLVTNGEGGFKYSTLAESIYGLELTDEAVGRAALPNIRKAEFLEGARAMRVDHAFFLDQTDHRYTLDPHEVLDEDRGVWDLAQVQSDLLAILRAGHYDFVLTFVPREETHGHHKAAAILALRAVAALSAAERPIVLGVRFDESTPPEIPLAEYPITKLRTDVGPFVFDRTQHFGYRDKLDYRIVANWAIAAHKTQGTMQLLMNGGEKEAYWLYALDAPGSETKARELFARLAEPQFEAKEYDESAEAPR